MANVEIISRRELRHCRQWQRAFSSQHKDSRYYEIVEDTLHPEFKYLYFAVRDCHGEIHAIQPFFILDQDILAGVRAYCAGLIDVRTTSLPSSRCASPATHPIIIVFMTMNRGQRRRTAIISFISELITQRE